MQIVNCEQKSDEWFKLREKRLTASHGTAIGACGKGLVTYVNQLMMEFYSTGEPVRFQSKGMKGGNELEDSASFMYCMETGYEVEKIGFVIHNDFVGCSPDNFICPPNSEGMAEIKCREDKAYWEILRGGKIDSGQIWQTQMSMLICEKEWCDCVDYNPNFKKNLIIRRVFPDPKKFAALERGFFEGAQLIQEIEEEMEIRFKQ